MAVVGPGRCRALLLPVTCCCLPVPRGPRPLQELPIGVKDGLGQDGGERTEWVKQLGVQKTGRIYRAQVLTKAKEMGVNEPPWPRSHMESPLTKSTDAPGPALPHESWSQAGHSSVWVWALGDVLSRGGSECKA